MKDFEEKDTGTLSPDMEQAKRQSRRKVLKTGAALAPLALTLSTGNAMATNRIAVSGAACVSGVKDKSRRGHKGLQIPKEHRTWMSRDHKYKKPHKTSHFDDMDENHWDYLKKNKVEGCSCLHSMDAAEYIDHKWNGGGGGWWNGG
ncbi:hypothetical protein [Emcibacter sp.]|uniref:hypothetical protein n=1 Tax=Emcibacter sp. TaxID=1979954 RepID=UPI003A8DB5C4